MLRRSRPRVASGVVIEAGVARRSNVRIPLSDGVTLSADLALPGALPALHGFRLPSGGQATAGSATAG